MSSRRCVSGSVTAYIAARWRVNANRRLLNCFAALDRLRLLRVGYVQRVFGKYIRIDERLDNIAPRPGKCHVSKDCYVIGITISRNLEGRRRGRGHGLNSIGSQNAHFRKVLALTRPVVEDDQL